MSDPDTRRGSGAAAGAAGLVGRRHELRLLRQAVTLRRPVLLFGPPGVSKTTMLRELAGPAGHDHDAVHWVTGDEQLSAHVLVGTFDPSLVLREGYRAEHFSPGPLTRAMRDGGILYIEELNRAPSGALNVLITALSEGFTLAGSEMASAATKAGLPVVTEFFADRPLRGDGSVVMFGWADVFSATPETLSARVRDLLTTGQVQALDGTPVTVRASTVCVHSDTPGAELLGPAVRAVFDELSVPVQAPGWSHDHIGERHDTARRRHKHHHGPE